MLVQFTEAVCTQVFMSLEKFSSVLCQIEETSTAVCLVVYMKPLFRRWLTVIVRVDRHPFYPHCDVLIAARDEQPLHS
jgi:hypothetical protein